MLSVSADRPEKVTVELAARVVMSETAPALISMPLIVSLVGPVIEPAASRALEK